MAITGRAIVLHDKDGNAVFPETSSQAVYMDSGETLQNTLQSTVTFEENNDIIEFQKPEMIQKVNNIESEVQELSSQLEHKASKINNIFYLEHDSSFIGNGIDDDSRVIQKWIDYVESIGGGKIIFPYKKTIRLSKQGTRSIKTWHSGLYSRMYSLLLPSNIEIDFNHCTLSIDLDNDTKGMVMAIENKNADNNSIGDNNIILRNLIINCNVEFNGIYDTTLLGAYDRHGLSLNNINNLILDNVSINNTLGYALYLCNARNFKIIGGLSIQNNMGCGFRLGWSDNTINGYIESVNIINASNKYENWLATNTIYCIADNITIDTINQYFNNSDYINMDIPANIRNSSSNFTLCNNLNIGVYNSEYLGIKVQNYKNDITGACDNVNINKILIKNSFINIQANNIYINEFIMKNSGYINENDNRYHVFNIWDTANLNIENVIIENGSIALKSNNNLLDTVNIKNLKLINSFISSTTNKGIVTIQKLNSIRNQTQGEVLTNTTKYIYRHTGMTFIDKIIINNDINCDTKTNLLYFSKGDCIKSVTGISTNGKTYVDNFIINLSSGDSSMIQLNVLDEDKLVYKNSNNMFYIYELIPLNSSARNIKFTNKSFSNYFERINLEHNNADGTEQFYVKITNYILADTVSW